MEPLDPNDPLWKLLGKARPVEPRSNFTQNVLRAARQTQQTRGWWAMLLGRLQDNSVSLPRVMVGAAAALALAALVTLQLRTPDTPPVVVQKTVTPAAVTVAEPPILAVETQLESIDQVSALLALEDTSTLTDSEINFLLY